ncbi:glycoside hydrolase family 3 protein [Nesterenkonia sp. F]|uniref:beta-glucosidase n=1 Tax=Nesterenkonia sp. F TaxID=795955 RepID=UPI000255CA45|nr:glycoside hydrolase family 3 C-terminal domain-containing protein [Nesterenkonia sp. F]
MSSQTTTDYAALISRLSLDEKVHLLTGETAFTLPGNGGIGLAPLAFSDGPTGVRGLKFFGGDHVALFPNATLVSGAWDDDVARQVGEMLSEEARRQDIHVVLGPTINLHRTALGGRLFEAYSEDPYLTGRTAVNYVQGLQGAGTAACLKHLVANESEQLRNFMDSRVSEEALREVYLLPFEMAVEDAGAWSMMAAYNDVNGVPATEQDEVQNRIVKDEWGWDGLIMSDWFATKRTAPAANGGLDLVMPGPDGPWGDHLVAAVRDGQVAESTVDDHLTRLLRLADRTGGLDTGAGVRTFDETFPAPDSSVRAEQLKRLAARGMVVVKNDGDALPLSAGSAEALTAETLAVVGRHALKTQDMGGGSAQVSAPYYTSVAEGVAATFGPDVPVLDGPAVRRRPLEADPTLLTHPETGETGLEVTITDAEGTVLSQYTSSAPSLSLGFDDDFTGTPARVTLRARFAHPGGAVDLGAVGAARWTLHHTDAAGTAHQVAEHLTFTGMDPGEGMLCPPAFDRRVDLAADSVITAVADLEPVDWRETLLPRTELNLSEESHLLAMGAFGRLTLTASTAGAGDDELIDDAAAAAERAGTAVVVVGLTEEDETEAADKSTLALPGRQDDLVRAVSAAAEKTVVVVNAATPVLMPWLDDVDAVLIAGLPGQEGGHAIAAVLSGELEPTGRLVTTYPAADGAAPAWSTTPGDDLGLDYADGTAVGHRGWSAGDADAPLFWFGHGLGYGSWKYGEAELVESGEQAGASGAAEAPTVRVPVTNTSSRDSRETVQVYFQPAEAGQPVRLVGYQGVDVPAGAAETVEVACDRRLFRRWDAASGAWAPLVGGELLVARGLGDVRARLSLS